MRSGLLAASILVAAHAAAVPRPSDSGTGSPSSAATAPRSPRPVGLPVAVDGELGGDRLVVGDSVHGRLVGRGTALLGERALVFGGAIALSPTFFGTQDHLMASVLGGFTIGRNEPFREGRGRLRLDVLGETGLHFVHVAPSWLDQEGPHGSANVLVPYVGLRIGPAIRHHRTDRWTRLTGLWFGLRRDLSTRTATYSRSYCRDERGSSPFYDERVCTEEPASERVGGWSFEFGLRIGAEVTPSSDPDES